MENIIRKHGIKIILFLLALIALLIVLFTQLNNPSKAFPLNEPAPDFELTDVNGETVSLANTNGKVRLVYFYFSHCTDVCPPTTHMLSQVQQLLKEQGDFGERAALFSITFDPERDTRERLLEFSGKYNADYSGWYFVRGDEAYTRKLAEDFGVMIQEQEDGSFAHSNLFFIIDKKGNIRTYLNANNLDLTPEDVVRDMNALM